MSVVSADFLVKLYVQLAKSTVVGVPLPLSDIIERCHLQPILEQRSTRLSGGQRQRLLLALALINDPDIVFLDEPTTGLDPQSRRNFWELINNIKTQGKTIILTTHYMDEAELLCNGW